jgi:hypothetical protein
MPGTPRLRKCQDCGHDMSVRANVCPNCGADHTRPRPMTVRDWVVALILAAVLVVFVGVLFMTQFR